MSVFAFLDDNQKLDALSDVISGLTNNDTMRCCEAGCKDGENLHWHEREGDTCPNCGNIASVPKPMTAEMWASLFEMDMSTVSGFRRGRQAIFTLPFDAWISTVNDTITVKLKTGFETYPLPPRNKWVFDLERLFKGRRPKRYRIRKGAVTAA